MLIASLLAVTDAVAAAFLAADLLAVCVSVVLRSLFNAPVEWADDVARGLMVGSTFFGVASAVARSENFGLVFLVGKLPPYPRQLVDAVGALLVTIVSATVAYDLMDLCLATSGQTTGSGLPAVLSIYPMGIGAVCMTIFALDLFCRRPLGDMAGAMAIVFLTLVLYLAWSALSPSTAPSTGVLMIIGFFISLCGGLPIGFALGLCALTFVWTEALPGVIFAQQMSRGIDNFVLLAIPFFILVGYLMEANGMSVRLIGVLQRLIGHIRGGLNVVIVVSMVLFSGISGSKVADVAAIGSVLIPAARRTGQNPGSAVALLAVSAIMGEAIPPCMNLIILGFVANISIGGLFMAGLLPAGLMALALVAVCIIFGKRPEVVAEVAPHQSWASLWGGGAAAFGLILLIFVGFKSGFATATEISAFAAVYAIVVGAGMFRELSWRGAIASFAQAATRSGMVLFIVSTASSLAFMLTLQEVPHALGEAMISVSRNHGTWLFMVLAIAILVVMGSVLEGAAALVIFAPLLVPVATQLGVDPLQFGVVLVVAMGIGVFAPPLGLGLYSACLIGNVPFESTIKPILGYLAVLFAVLLVIAFVPAISTALPRALGY